MSESKVGRTVRLEPDMNDRLVALCEHLGVNVNAYLVGEIGKAVSRDEVAYKASQHTSDMAQLIVGMMSELRDATKE